MFNKKNTSLKVRYFCCLSARTPLDLKKHVWCFMQSAWRVSELKCGAPDAAHLASSGIHTPHWVRFQFIPQAMGCLASLLLNRRCMTEITSWRSKWLQTKHWDECSKPNLQISLESESGERKKALKSKAERMASLQNFSTDVKAVPQQRTSTSSISHTNEASVSHRGKLGEGEWE